MNKNLKSFLLLLIAGMFGMLLTVSCGSDDVLADIEDTAVTDEPASADETAQWTEQTQMAAKELVGKWQLVYTMGCVGEYDERLEVFEDGTMKYYRGDEVLVATYILRNDWKVRVWEDEYYDLAGVDEYGNNILNRRVNIHKYLEGGFYSPEWSLYDRGNKDIRYDISCSIHIEGKPSEQGELKIVRDYPDAIHCVDPAKYFKRIE